jgi:hypothetical protein
LCPGYGSLLITGGMVGLLADGWAVKTRKRLHLDAEDDELGGLHRGAMCRGRTAAGRCLYSMRRSSTGT